MSKGCAVYEGAGGGIPTPAEGVGGSNSTSLPVPKTTNLDFNQFLANQRKAYLTLLKAILVPDRKIGA